MFRVTVKTPLKRKQKKCAKPCFVGNGLRGCFLGHFPHPSTKQKKAVSWSVCLKTVSTSWRFLFTPKALADLFWWRRHIRWHLWDLWIELTGYLESVIFDMLYFNWVLTTIFATQTSFSCCDAFCWLYRTAVLVHSISQNLVLALKGSAFEEGLRPTESEWPVWFTNNKDSSKWKGYAKTWKTKKFDVWLSFKVSLPFLTSSTFAAGLKHLKKMLQVCPRPWKDGDDAGYSSLLCLGGQSYQPQICYRL